MIKKKNIIIFKRILLSPIITEKTNKLKENENKIVFKVNKKASKREIINFINKKFNVKVKKINFINVKKKIKKRGKIIGYSPSIKKAIIKLDKSSMMHFFKKKEINK